MSAVTPEIVDKLKVLSEFQAGSVARVLVEMAKGDKPLCLLGQCLADQQADVMDDLNLLLRSFAGGFGRIGSTLPQPFFRESGMGGVYGYMLYPWALEVHDHVMRASLPPSLHHALLGLAFGYAPHNIEAYINSRQASGT